MEVKRRVNSIFKNAQKDSIVFELKNSEYDCYTNYQKRELMKLIRGLSGEFWTLDDVRKLLQSDAIKNNVDRLIYLFECSRCDDQKAKMYASDLIYILISGVRDGEDVNSNLVVSMLKEEDIDFNLAVSMLSEYVSNGSSISPQELLNVSEELILPRLNSFFHSSIKLSLFKAIVHSTKTGYDLGHKLLHLYKLCDNRSSLGAQYEYSLYDEKKYREFKRCFPEKSKDLRRDFDCMASFETLEHAFNGLFDENPVVKELIEQVYFEYDHYEIAEDLFSYSLDVFDRAFEMFKVLNEEAKKIDEPSSGTPNVLLK